MLILIWYCFLQTLELLLHSIKLLRLLVEYVHLLQLVLSEVQLLLHLLRRHFAFVHQLEALGYVLLSGLRRRFLDVLHRDIKLLGR